MSEYHMQCYRRGSKHAPRRFRFQRRSTRRGTCRHQVRSGGSDMFRVVYVVHFAMDASPDQPSSAIQLTVSRDLKLRADPR